MFRPARAARRLLLVALAALAPGACRDAASALGDSPAAARANADELLSTLGARFGPVQLDPRVLAARVRFARGALAPSRLVNDSTAWTEMRGATRTLEIAGNRTAAGYRLGVRAGLPAPALAGEYRRVTRLRALGEGEYHWSVVDELAIGGARGADLHRAWAAALRALERSDERAIRLAYRGGMPRTTAALGRLFTLDSLRVAPAPDGATDARLVLTMHTRRLAEELPRYAKYLDKYVAPLAFRIVVLDGTGARWWEARARDERLTLHLRVKDGALVPLDGPPRRIPDTLRARIDFSAKAMLFRVGVKALAADVTLLHGETSGFTARFRREPEWQLPPLVERMIRSPLRRPFQGEGASLSYTLRDGRDGAATVAARDYELTVRESAIVRWFGSLGNAALSDFRQGAEREADRFVGELWSALRADVLALVPAR